MGQAKLAALMDLEARTSKKIGPRLCTATAQGNKVMVLRIIGRVA